MAATILVIMAWLSRDLAAPNPPTGRFTSLNI
jgi:hypothetical protein